ncbi:MAG TPA: hypothetical protein VMR88_15410, partial [Candidatus Polarisedimenticolaceae bacterium]|nr:hypothetical protein [Candidatus Polarisedimenticolaceae bacterium]
PGLPPVDPFLLCETNVTHLLGELTRFVPDHDTIIEILIVLGIVTMVFLFSRVDNLQSVATQVTPYASEASPAINQR